MNYREYIKSLTNEQLRVETKSCAAREKKEMALLIEHLVEVEQRQLYLEWGHGSLYAYVVDELQYDRGAASDRNKAVQAALAVADLPKKIETGELTLSSIRRVESFAYHEGMARNKEFTKTEKRELYSKIANLSVVDTEKTLVEMATSEKFLAPKKEIDRAVKGGQRVVQVTLTEEEYEYLLYVREATSHTNPGASNSEVISYALKYTAERKHPKLKANRAVQKAKGVEQKDEKSNALIRRSTGYPTNDVSCETESQNENSTVVKRSRYIPAKVIQEVWKDYDDKGCTYIDFTTGKRCGSTHKLQPDHIVEFYKGGEHTKKNLRPYCARHNNFRNQQTVLPLFGE